MSRYSSFNLILSISTLYIACFSLLL
uniref:Paramecium tetraurelia macronuclear actin 1 isoform exons 1-3 n=1 Tax=Triatoma infestans TaxID=30076 RepID=A0A170Z8X4_TRIIF